MHCRTGVTSVIIQDVRILISVMRMKGYSIVCMCDVSENEGKCER